MSLKIRLLIIIFIILIGSIAFYIFNTRNLYYNNETNNVENNILSTETVKSNKISFDDMKTIIEKGNLKDYIILDVRTEEEYKEKRIPNAILIPQYEIEKAEIQIPNKDTYIFVYCRSGARSAAASLKLIEMGYTNIYDVGGIIYYNGETISN